MQRSGRLRQGPLQRGDRLQQGPLQRGGRLRLGPARKGAAPARGQTARAAARGWSAAARRPQGAAAARGHAAGAAANSLQTVAHGQPARGDRLRVRRPQGLLLARVVASSGSTCRGGARGGVGRRGGRPLAERLPVGKCSFAACTGQWRRWGQEGLRHSFGEKDDFAPLNLKNSDDCPQRGGDSGTHDVVVRDYDAW
ncbi:hypothetical protein BHE74_00019384 [Ensete ventricosum]|nr:hypothetical protein BHE74_00019384 [Ensete ventricosum]